MRFGKICWTLAAMVASLTATVSSAHARTRQDGQDVLPARPIPVGQVHVPSVSFTAGDSVELAERTATLEKWVREYSEWKEWEERWRGKLQPGWVGYRERRTKPAPPSWLAEECSGLEETEGLFADACRLLGESRDGRSAEQIRARVLARNTEHENFTKWWNSVHLDALWLAPSTSPSYGVVGIHATLKVAGRWQVFVAPGAILLNMPAPRNAREWVAGTDLGMSYRLFDVAVPGSRQGTVHLNFARVWILGDSNSAVSKTVDLFGLSLTLK